MHIKQRAELDQFLLNLGDSDPLVRQEAAIALGDFCREDHPCIDVLIERLQSSAQTLHDRALAAWALGRIKSNAGAVVPILLTLLGESRDQAEADELRSYAAEAVERLSDDVGALTTVASHGLQDRSEKCRMRGLFLVERLLKRQPDLAGRFVPLIEPLARDASEEIREHARRLLIRCKKASSRRFLAVSSSNRVANVSRPSDAAMAAFCCFPALQPVMPGRAEDKRIDCLEHGFLASHQAHRRRALVDNANLGIVIAIVYLRSRIRLFRSKQARTNLFSRVVLPALELNSPRICKRCAMRRHVAVVLLLLFASPAWARVWTDDTGEKQTEAEFVSLVGEMVEFRLPSGDRRRCRLNKLSAADQAVIATLTKAETPATDVPATDVPVTDVPATNVPVTPPAAAPAKEATQELTSAATTAVGGCATPCPPEATYQCTVMVPQMTTEMRKIMVCEWRTEERQATYTACRIVPETRQVTYQYTVPTYETRMREIVYSVCKPVYSTRQREFTVMVPYIEKRQATRTECHMVPVEMTRTVCTDRGSWQQVVHHSGCDCCGGCDKVCNTWVPKWEQQEVKYTVMRPQTRSVPYEYSVTLCKPEKRTEDVQVCNYVAEQLKKNVPYTVCVPVTKTGTRQVTNYRTVQEQKTRTYTVRVPHQVEKEVPVQVCHMVAKLVTMKVPVCGSVCGPCGGCW